MLVKCKVGAALQGASGDDPFVLKDRAETRQVSSLYKLSALWPWLTVHRAHASSGVRIFKEFFTIDFGVTVDNLVGKKS